METDKIILLIAITLALFGLVLWLREIRRLIRAQKAFRQIINNYYHLSDIDICNIWEKL